MDLSQFKKVHFIGIGGIGVSAVAKMMILLGKKVSGSDLFASEITDDLKREGAKIFIGHQKENLAKDIDLVIYSPAVPEDNIERKRARELEILSFSYPKFLGKLSKNYFTITVSGTHGKTTTTALIGLILEKAGLDPTVVVGSKVNNFQEGNFRFGKSKYLVVEACEWRAHMLNFRPQIIVLTNLEEDHLDYYKNLDDIIFHFQKYIDQMSGDGKIILNIDNENLFKRLLPHRKVVSYGIKKPADVVAKNIKIISGFQEFDLIVDSKVHHLRLKVPGIFNIYNALAASTAALSLGIKLEIIREVLENYSGCWRRFEVKDFKIENLKLKIISDYAHHPTAIQETIQAAREFYPNKRIFVIFQPHHHHRTKVLFDDFVKSFDRVDLAIISEIYGVAGREKSADQNISSKDLVKKVIERTGKKIIYTRNLEETKKLILKNIQPNDVILIMGAGDIYTIIDQLIK
ncbi:MAG: UDP-N-acetylmuramate--L-alanine ligase [Patescibacteria group bacterium]|nr:UDP-N-acetylmuramate--L-alanine ligase [Patescibacteria group bacterium]